MKRRNCWYTITTTFHEIFVLECFHDKISLSFSHFYKKLLVRGQDSSTGFLYKLLSGLKRRARNQSTRTGLAGLLTDTDFNTTIVTQGNGVLTMDFINRIYQIITKS